MDDELALLVVKRRTIMRKYLALPKDDPARGDLLEQADALLLEIDELKADQDPAAYIVGMVMLGAPPDTRSDSYLQGYSDVMQNR